MALNAIAGKPGVQSTTYTATPREIFYDSRAAAKFIPGPVSVDGTLSGNPGNSPYDYILFAGTPVGRVTNTGKYAVSILGVTTVAYADNDLTLTTSAATAKEIVRRIGTSGTFKLTGPPAAAGVVAVTTVTFSAVDTSSGVITVSDLNLNKIAGSWIQPTDGSETIVTLIADTWGLKVADAMNVNRVDVFDAELWAGGGIINTGYIYPAYPSDTSLRAYLKAAIRVSVPDAKFSDDLINS